MLKVYSPGKYSFPFMVENLGKNVWITVYILFFIGIPCAYLTLE